MDWNTTLVVKAKGVPIAHIDSFKPKFLTPTTVLHSIEADNVGVAYKSQTATFTMQVQAIGDSVATLTKMALAGEKFEIEVAEQQGTDWAFKKLLFRECVITEASPGDIVPGAPPVATFTGVILKFGEKDDIEI